MKYFTYKGNKLRMISFPLGGIGTGCIGLSGTGRLIDWEIFNRPSKGSVNGFSHFAVKAERNGKLMDARILQGDITPPFSGTGFGVPRETMGGLPHFLKTEFKGGFPFAEVHFSDPHFPGKVILTAFNPFIPLNDSDSSIPGAFFTVTLNNPLKYEVDYTAGFTLRNPADGNTINLLKRENGMSFIHMTGDAKPSEIKYSDFSMGTDAGDVSAQEYWYRGQWFDNLEVYWKDFNRAGKIKSRTYNSAGKGDHAVLTARLKLKPGEKKNVKFIFTWNVPNCYNYWKKNGSRRKWKNYYATVFPDSVENAKCCMANWDRLEKETRLFRDTLLKSTIPRVFLDAVSANISILKTPTCLRLEDGSFYGWEGCGLNTGSCEGSCTHVWNYAYALPFLFPSLERSMRELDYKFNQGPDGGMSFRLQLPLGSNRSDMRPCVDGQFGGVVKTYREWKISGDTSWLKKIWPRVRKSLEFAWAVSNKDLWDPCKTGVIQGRQHHTLDMELFGPNSWLTGFYLAALKAGAEMAEACGEPQVASEYRIIFNRGKRWVEKNLFNGKYFIQRIDMRDKDLLSPHGKNENIWKTYWNGEDSELKYQVGEGCGIDQVVAQWHADLIGLGDIFDKEQVISALREIYKNNYHSAIRNLINPCRLYCVGDEAGTVMFSWPKKVNKPVIPIPYAEETMHGFEYQFAGHMVLNGMVEEGIKVVKAVRDRYDGERRNPWNEIECGSNYARSMASYALLNAYSGFSFDMTKNAIGFKPSSMVSGHFRCFWSLETAWGEIDIRQKTVFLRVLYGKLVLREILLDIPGSRNIKSVFIGRKKICFKVQGETVNLDRPVEIDAGSRLLMEID